VKLLSLEAWNGLCCGKMSVCLSVRLSHAIAVSKQNSSNVFTIWQPVILFFSARQHICLGRYMLLPARLSVRRVYRRKTVEVRIMKFSPYGSHIPSFCG